MPVPAAPSDPAAPKNPAERVRQQLKDWMEAAGCGQREFAKRLGRTQPWLDKILVGENNVRLKDLDDIAQHMNMTASELVRAEDDRRMLELTPSEFRLIQRLRRRRDLLDACLVLVEAHRTETPATTTRANPFRRR